MIYTVDLPSLGKVKGVPRTIKINEWSLLDIKDFSKANKSALDDALTASMDRSLVQDNPNAPIRGGMFVSQDRWHILLSLRVNTMGSDYSFFYYHHVMENGENKCGFKNEVDVDLVKDIEVKDIPAEYVEHVGVKLPCGIWARIKVPTHLESREARALFEKRIGKSYDDLDEDDADLSVFALAQYVSGKDQTRFGTILDSLKFVESLNAKDVSALMDAVGYFRIWGPMLSMKRTCGGCAKEYSFRLPLLDSFFYSKSGFEFDLKAAISAEPVFPPTDSGHGPA